MTPLERNQAIAAHSNIVRRVVFRLRPLLSRHWETQDLLGYAWIAFLRVLDAYDPTRFPNLPAYLTVKVRYLLLDLLREIDHSRRIGPHPIFVRMLPDDLPQMPQAHNSASLREIWDLTTQLPPRWISLLRLHYQHDRSLRECAQILGVNQSRASHIHKAAIRKLRELANA